MFNLRKIEGKQITSEQDLERERMAYAPVLGKDSWYACFGIALWRLITIHVLTPAGMWVISTTWLAYVETNKALMLEAIPENFLYIIGGFGLHCVLAWLWLCARGEARKILDALAVRLRGTNPLPADGEKK